MVGERIKNIRTEKGLSQEELAEALGVVRQTVSKWEKGLSAPDADMLIRLAQVLNTAANDLLGEEEPMAAAPKKRTLAWWEIVLIVLGFPIWFSLLAAALAVVIALYIVAWAVVIALWAVDASLGGAFVGGIVGGVIFLCSGHTATGIAVMAAALVCAGLAILLFFGCKAVTAGAVRLTATIARGIKARFARRGAA